MKFAALDLRHEKRADGEKQWFLIEKWKCNDCIAQKYHRALPDFLAPYKHYNADLIMDVIDGLISSDDPGYEDYPCEKTMFRWKEWFILNEAFIKEYLLICRARLIAYGLVILFELVSALDDIMVKTERWLSVILRIIYDTGAALEPYREAPG